MVGERCSAFCFQSQTLAGMAFIIFPSARNVCRGPLLLYQLFIACFRSGQKAVAVSGGRPLPPDVRVRLCILRHVLCPWRWS